MADLKVTKMVMKVDLQCSKCYRKIKKVLCRYPQIRDQVYDESRNTVTIKVVCCSPEKIKEKIACKAGDTVESIEIIPDKPKELEKKKVCEKPKPVEKREEPPKSEKPNDEFIEPPKEDAKPRAPAPAPCPGRPPVPVPMYPVCVSCCCRCCYKGGPCYHGRGPMCYDGCGRPAYECSGGNRGYYVSRCDEYFSEENLSGCSVM